MAELGIHFSLPQARARRLPPAKYRDSEPEGECLRRFLLVRRDSKRNWFKIMASWSAARSV